MMHQVRSSHHLRFDVLVARSERAIPGTFVSGPVEVSAGQLADELSACDNLSLEGVLAARTLILHALQTQRRLRRAGPLIERRESETIVIGGMPRTGTTLLQHVIAASAPLRNLTFWQALHPTAQIEARHGLAEFPVPRAIADAQCRVEELRMVEQVFARHPIDAYGIAECTPLLTSTLTSLEIPMMFDVPAFRDRLFGRSLDPEFGIIADQLAALEGQADQPWLLKSPLFVVDYDALFANVRPTAVMHVKRPAAQAFASFLELAIAARRQTSGQVDTPAVAWQMLDLWCSVLRRAADAISASRTPLVTVEYDDLVHSPVAALRALRAQVPSLDGRPVNTSRVEATAREQRQRHLPSSSSVEDFGLLTADVTNRLNDAAGGYFFSAAQ